MSDAKINTAVTVNEKIPKNDENFNVEDSVHTHKISYSLGLKAVKTTVQYFKPGASVMDLLFLRCLRDEEAKRRVQYG
ncbi:hypothetical protein TNCV_4659911 [Trichonephila clavipes]|uniref:Uncharacterized protein n=1 Tax=Trichonephila clavipes TaxID=2585209 RepID=A0A8X6VIA4_TRICX|nr:hypothetical protein TNCV_4659911 [Trichonephila clavipes]